MKSILTTLSITALLCNQAVSETLPPVADKESIGVSVSRPNIILFLIDDQDKDSIGAYGGKAFTPNLDRMAAEGMKFDRAYVSSAVCTPSRYGWATGRYAGTLVLFAPDHGRDGKSSLFTQDGVCIPMIARWPGHVPEGSVCDELVQNVDWAATVMDFAGVTKPDAYAMDGRSSAPLLLGESAEAIRDHVYIEMGAARGVATKDWKYIAVRYRQEQVDRIRKAKTDDLPRLMSYIGRLGIGTRGADHNGFWDADQLYDLRNDPDEMVNLAAEPCYADELRRMKALLTSDLKAGGRPFGEFIPGGNATPGGQIDKQIALVKQLEIQGKRIVVPKSGPTVNPEPPAGESRREIRMNRKAAAASPLLLPQP